MAPSRSSPRTASDQSVRAPRCRRRPGGELIRVSSCELYQVDTGVCQLVASLRSEAITPCPASPLLPLLWPMPLLCLPSLAWGRGLGTDGRRDRYTAADDRVAGERSALAAAAPAGAD